MKTVAMLTLLAAIHAVESDKGRNPRCGGNSLNQEENAK